MSAREAALALTLAMAGTARAAVAGDIAAPAHRTPPPAIRRGETPPATLHLAWLDPSGAAGGVAEMARSEVRSILGEAGLQIVWRRASTGELARPGEVLVILLARRLADGPSGHPILGSTPPGRRRHPHVWIHVVSERAVMGLESPAIIEELAPGSRRRLGVALGRVMAHEVVHAVAPSVVHGTALMSETLTRGDLDAIRISLDPAAAVAVRDAALGLSGSPRADDVTLAAVGLESAPEPGRLLAAGGAAMSPRQALDQ